MLLVSSFFLSKISKKRKFYLFYITIMRQIVCLTFSLLKKKKKTN